MSARTVRYVATLVGRSLGDAERQGLVMANVARRATPPSASSARAPEQQVWSPAHVGRFLDALDGSEWHAPLHVAAMTGMRRGEICGLEWGDVDLDGGVIQVRHTITAMAGKLIAGPAKTKRSRRRLDLDPGTVAVLRSWRRRQLEHRLAMGAGWPEGDLVFTYADGTGIHPDVLTAAFRRLSAPVEGLPRIRLHDLRHSRATALLAAGVNVRVVADRLGHASVAFTLDTYGHSLPGQQLDAANAVAALVAGDQL